jgi:hypothetical protein
MLVFEMQPGLFAAEVSPEHLNGVLKYIRRQAAKLENDVPVTSGDYITIQHDPAPESDPSPCSVLYNLSL